MAHIQIVQVVIGKLRSAEYSSRKWTAEQKKNLKRSIVEHGFVDPVIVNGNPKRKNIVIGGYFRLACARELGYKKVPAVYVNIADRDREKKLSLRLNHSTGEFDWSLLGKYFTKDLLLDVGFTQEELNLNLDMPDPEGFNEEVQDDVPALRKTTIKVADMFQLGDHMLICGDATDILLLDKLMWGHKASMLFTDPPYGVSIAEKNKLLNKVNLAGGGNTTPIQNDNLPAEKLQKVLMKVFGNCREHLDKNASYYVTAPISGDIGIMMATTLRDAGLPSRHTLLWVKNTATFSMGRLDYEYQHEPIYYGWQGSHTFYGRGDHKTTCWFIEKPTASKDHPTMKPVELVENALRNSTIPGQIVLDPFCGSGTTLIAAEKTGRKCYAVELMPVYCQVIIDRWEQLTGQKANKL